MTFNFILLLILFFLLFLLFLLGVGLPHVLKL
jgi:hypothetical protein